MMCWIEKGNFGGFSNVGFYGKLQEVGNLVFVLRWLLLLAIRMLIIKDLKWQEKGWILQHWITFVGMVKKLSMMYFCRDSLIDF